MPSRPSRRQRNTAACTCDRLELERRARDHRARAAARVLLARQPQLEAGAALAPAAVVDGRDARVLDLVQPRRPTISAGAHPLVAVAGGVARAAGQRQQRVALVDQRGDRSAPRRAPPSAAPRVVIAKVPRQLHRRARPPRRARGRRGPSRRPGRPRRPVGSSSQLELVRRASARQPSPSCSSSGPSGVRGGLAPVEQQRGARPRRPVELAVGVEEREVRTPARSPLEPARSARRTRWRCPRRRTARGACARCRSPRSRSAGPRRRTTRRRITARVGGISSSRPTMSVRKPGVIRKAPPKITSTPSSTSRWGIRPAGSASLKRRQTARPWERSSTEPSTESAARSPIVGHTRRSRRRPR